jgi:hypothetical protein
MNTSIDIDNRNHEDVIPYLEARIEALSSRIQELERENHELRRVLNQKHDAHLGATEH